MSTLAITEENTMPKKDFQNVQLRDVEHRGGLRLALNSFAELEKFSHFMALSNFMPKHLRNKQADCLAVLLQALRWEMDPFSVAQKTYFVNDGMAYEAQLVNAIVLSRAQIKTRPKLSWTGESEDLKCKVSATFLGEDEPLEFEAEMKTITTRNSPLWKQQPKQQLGYFALRAWARLYCPDVLMGIYTKDEMEDASMHIGSDNAIDITGDRSVVEDMAAHIAAEKKAMKEPVPPYDPETGEILDMSIMGEPSTITDDMAQGSQKNINTTAPAPNADDWISDIESIPTLDGLKYKYSQAQKLFKDSTDFARIHAAKEKRKLELRKMYEQLDNSRQGAPPGNGD